MSMTTSTVTEYMGIINACMQCIKLKIYFFKRLLSFIGAEHPHFTLAKSEVEKCFLITDKPCTIYTH